MTPLYLRFLGVHDYGIWAMVTSLVGYMGLLDLGLRSSVTRHVSLLNKQNRHEETNQLFATAMAYMSLVGVSLLGFFWFWSGYSPESLSASNFDDGTYKTFLIFVGCSVFLSFIRNTAEGALEGKQFYVAKNLAKLVIKIILAAYLYLNIDEENALILLIQATVVAEIGRVVLFNALLWTSHPPINPLRMPSFDVFITLFKFGSKSLLNGLGLAIGQASGAFLIGILLTPAAIPLYSVTLSITGYISNFIDSANSTLLPYFTELSLDNERANLANSFLFFSKIFVWFLFTATTFVVMFGADFIDIWLDSQFKKSEVQWLVLLFSFSILLERINPVGVKLATALNQHGIFARLRPVSAVAVFVGSYVLVGEVGITGAVYAKIAIAMIFTPIFLRHSLRLVAIEPAAYMKECIFRNAAILTLLPILSIIYKIYFSIQDFTSIIFVFIMFSLISAVILYTITLTSSEKQIVLQMLRKKNIAGIKKYSDV